MDEATYRCARETAESARQMLLDRARYTGSCLELVNLETHQVIDLLPDRPAETLTAWLRQHPEVVVISRDRVGAYAEGAQVGAPQATQVTDQLHLLKNVSEAL